MRSGAAAGHRGYFHEAAFYGSDDEFLAIVLPFLAGGIEAGEPTAVALDERKAELIRAAMGDTASITFLEEPARDARPTRFIREYRELAAAHVAEGARQVRIVGELPLPGMSLSWEWWARYEAAINHAFDEFPLWGVCSYDTRLAPAEVLADVARTHPHVATADGQHLPNSRFEDPAEFLAGRPAARADPLEAAAPTIDLVNPTPVGARRAVLDCSRATHLDEAEVDDFVYAVSEVVTNALCHGNSPVRLQLWSSGGRMVATVTDGGHGFTDPLAGFLPMNKSFSGGLGLWLAHQMCDHVTFGRDDEGFKVRLVVGLPALAP